MLLQRQLSKGQPEMAHASTGEDVNLLVRPGNWRPAEGRQVSSDRKALRQPESNDDGLLNSRLITSTAHLFIINLCESTHIGLGSVAYESSHCELRGLESILLRAPLSLSLSLWLLVLLNWIRAHFGRQTQRRISHIRLAPLKQSLDKDELQSLLVRAHKCSFHAKL